MLSEAGVSDAWRLNDRAPRAQFLESLARSLRASKKLASKAAVTVRRHSRRALLHTCETIFFVTVTVASAIWLVHGVIGGLTRLFGGERWVGELAGATLLLGTTIAVVIASTARDERRASREVDEPAAADDAASLAEHDTL
jgi:hypothetical protein